MANIIQLIPAEYIVFDVKYTKTLVLRDPDNLTRELFLNWQNSKIVKKEFNMLQKGNVCLIFFEEEQTAKEAFEFMKDCINFINSYLNDLKQFGDE